MAIPGKADAWAPFIVSAKGCSHCDLHQLPLFSNKNIFLIGQFNHSYVKCE